MLIYAGLACVHTQITELFGALLGTAPYQHWANIFTWSRVPTQVHPDDPHDHNQPLFHLTWPCVVVL